MCKTFAVKVDAERWARALEREIDQGGYCERSKAETVTLADVLERYIEEVCPGKRGGAEDAIRLRAMMRLSVARLNLARIRPRDIAAYRDARLKTCTPGTVLRDLSALSAILNHARKEWGYAVVNPVSEIRKPSQPAGRDRILSYEEEMRLLAALEPIGRRSPYMQPLVIVAVETAMRRGEMLGMTWSAVNLEKRTVYLPLTKNGEARTVPLSGRAVDTLARMARSITGRVFPMQAAAMERAFSQARKRAGLEGLHFHDLRHTATTRLAEKLNLLELAAVTGHKDLRMLKRYYHPKAEELAKKLG